MSRLNPLLKRVGAKSFPEVKKIKYLFLLQNQRINFEPRINILEATIRKMTNKQLITAI